MNNKIKNFENSITSHRHDNFHQIVIPIMGELELDIDGRFDTVSGRTIGIVSQGEHHSFHSVAENKFIVLDVYNSSDSDIEKIWDRAITEPFQTLSETLLSLTDFVKYGINQDMSEDLLYIWQSLFLKSLASELDNNQDHIPSRIKKALQYIELNYARQISNVELSTISCLSPSRFHQVFQNTLGVSPQNYIKEKRMKMAKKMMSSGQSLAQISYCVGYSSQASFTRAFKQINNMSPGQWKKQQRRVKIKESQ